MRGTGVMRVQGYMVAQDMKSVRPESTWGIEAMKHLVYEV